MNSLESVRGESVSLQTWPHFGHAACLSPLFISHGVRQFGQMSIMLRSPLKLSDCFDACFVF